LLIFTPNDVYIPEVVPLKIPAIDIAAVVMESGVNVSAGSVPGQAWRRGISEERIKLRIETSC